MHAPKLDSLYGNILSDLGKPEGLVGLPACCLWNCLRSLSLFASCSQPGPLPTPRAAAKIRSLATARQAGRSVSRTILPMLALRADEIRCRGVRSVGERPDQRRSRPRDCATFRFTASEAQAKSRVKRAIINVANLHSDVAISGRATWHRPGPDAPVRYSSDLRVGVDPALQAREGSLSYESKDRRQHNRY